MNKIISVIVCTSALLLTAMATADDTNKKMLSDSLVELKPLAEIDFLKPVKNDFFNTAHKGCHKPRCMPKCSREPLI